RADRPNARRAAPGRTGWVGMGFPSAKKWWVEPQRHANPSPSGPVRPRAARAAFIVARADGSQTLLFTPLKGKEKSATQTRAPHIHPAHTRPCLRSRLHRQEPPHVVLRALPD